MTDKTFIISKGLLNPYSLKLRHSVNSWRLFCKVSHRPSQRLPPTSTRFPHPSLGWRSYSNPHLIPLVLELEGEQQLLLSCPTGCATDRVSQHSCWMTDTGVRKWSLLPFYYSCSSVSGEAACVVLGMASMSVCGPIPISVSQAEWLSAAVPFVQGNC